MARCSAMLSNLVDIFLRQQHTTASTQEPDGAPPAKRHKSETKDVTRFFNGSSTDTLQEILTFLSIGDLCVARQAATLFDKHCAQVLSRLTAVRRWDRLEARSYGTSKDGVRIRWNKECLHFATFIYCPRATEPTARIPLPKLDMYPLHKIALSTDSRVRVLYFPFARFQYAYKALDYHKACALIAKCKLVKCVSFGDVDALNDIVSLDRTASHKPAQERFPPTPMPNVRALCFTSWSFAAAYCAREYKRRPLDGLLRLFPNLEQLALRHEMHSTTANVRVLGRHFAHLAVEISVNLRRIEIDHFDRGEYEYNLTNLHELILVDRTFRPNTDTALDQYGECLLNLSKLPKLRKLHIGVQASQKRDLAHVKAHCERLLQIGGRPEIQVTVAFSGTECEIAARFAAS